MRWIAISLMVLLAGFMNISYSQSGGFHVLNGQVRNADSGQPLENVHIFLDQTIFGATSDENGDFSITNIPGDHFNLVASVDGFEMFSQTISVSDLQSKRLLIVLYPSDEELHDVITKAEQPEEWSKNFETFKTTFLGSAGSNSSMEILNPEILGFSQNDGKMTAVTHQKPLVLINRDLGYEINYYLQRVELEDDYVNASGFSRFSELTPANELQYNVWREQRKLSYRGSFRHFLHALDRDKTSEEGFRIFYADSRQDPAEMTKVYSSPEILDTSAGAGRIHLVNSRSSYIGVMFNEKKPGGQAVPQISWIELPRDTARLDLKTANFYHPYRPILHGHWSRTNRISNQLPGSLNLSPGENEITAKESASDLSPAEASMANSSWEQGNQLMENGLYEQALRGWEIISGQDAGGQVTHQDPRIGFSYIEAVAGRQMRTRYKIASKMYEAALTNAENGRFRQAFRDEIERLKPLIEDRDQLNTWQRLLREDRLGELGRSMQTFWQMLDPTLSTAYNERLIEHWERVAYVKEQYGKDAWKRNERAQHYLQYGAPARIKTGRLTVTGREIFAADVSNIARQFDRQPSYELWIYEDLVPDNPRTMFFMFGEDGDTGEFRRVDSLEELIPGSAFRQNSDGASIFFQLAYYDELRKYDSFFGQRFSEMSRILRTGGPTPQYSKMLKNRNEFQYRYRQRNVPDEKSTYASDLPEIPLEVYQYRMLNGDDEPVLATFVDSRPGRAYLIDQAAGGTFDPSAYRLVHGVRVAGEAHEVIYQSDEDAVVHPGGENGEEMVPSVTYIEIPNTPGGQQVFAAELYSPGQSTVAGAGQVFDEQVRGLGRYAAAQPSPLSTNSGELEVSDPIMGYDRGREEMHHPFGFRVSPDGLIPAGEDVVIHYEVYHLNPTPTQPARFTVDYSLEPGRGIVERMFKGKEQGVSLTLNFESVETVFRDNLEIATAALQPGEYTLSFTVTDTATGKQKSQSVVFTIQ